MERIIIDSNIWHYSYIIPKELKYKEIHQIAKTFIIEKLMDTETKIIITNYQVGEILELLREGRKPKKKK